MSHFESPSRKVFNFFNIAILAAMAVLCVLPIINILAISFSENTAAAAGYVKFWPIGFNIKSYHYVLARPAFWRSFLVTIERVFLGVGINMILTVLTAYPLSKSREKLRARTLYVWIFFFSTLFSGGLIPGYMLIFNLHLMDTIWALVLPGAVPVFNIILMLNFFRQIPNELEEAAFMDGASHFKTLFSIYIPCSLPSIATVALFSIVWHWNNYFDGMIFSNFPKNYPLQTYLRSILISSESLKLSGDDWKSLREINEKTIKAAQVFIGALPILCAYPFLQKYFVKGITLGSVKQ